jgi:hypothetical protein
VWYSVWDDAPAADRFAQGLERAWQHWAASRPDRRSEVVRLTVGGRPAVRLVDAPRPWRGWKAIPQVTLPTWNPGTR